MKKTEFNQLIKECIEDVLKESNVDWEKWEKEKYGEEGKDWVAGQDSINPHVRVRMQIQKRPDEAPTKTQSSELGFGDNPRHHPGRSSEPQKFHFSEENEETGYDEQEEIELINQIKNTSSVWMKTKSVEFYIASLEAIYRVSEKLLKMHGAK